MSSCAPARTLSVGSRTAGSGSPAARCCRAAPCRRNSRPAAQERAIGASRRRPMRSKASNISSVSRGTRGGSPIQTLSACSGGNGWPVGSSRPTCQNSFRSWCWRPWRSRRRTACSRARRRRRHVVATLLGLGQREEAPVQLEEAVDQGLRDAVVGDDHEAVVLEGRADAGREIGGVHLGERQGRDGIRHGPRILHPISGAAR
jgi:hypothetical protein